MQTYRGWAIYGNQTIAKRRGTTLYGENWADLKQRIDSYMANKVARGF